MKTKLAIEDAKALDLILDRGTSAVRGISAASFVNMVGNSDAVSPQRVQAVQKMLHLLDALPADEPSAGLTSRTMEHIASASPENASKRRHLSARGLTFGHAGNNHVS